MKILIIGEQANFEECREKLGDNHVYTRVGDHREAEKFFDAHELIFDFIIDEEPHEFHLYTDKSITVFLNTCKISLGELVHSAGHEMACTVFGFNGMPTLFNRAVLELAVWHEKDLILLKKICGNLGSEFMVVDDRVGLVTPRVVCMIINEAYYTVQEGTASRDDIDMAMRSGTNYPFGPFEWSRRIGIKHVYELLEAVYEDTKDERYKICPLLKREYLNQ